MSIGASCLPMARNPAAATAPAKCSVGTASWMTRTPSGEPPDRICVSEASCRALSAVSRAEIGSFLRSWVASCCASASL